MFVGDGTPPEFDLAFIGEVLDGDADGSRQGLRSTARAAQLPAGAEEGFLPAVHRFAGEGDIPQVGFGVEDFEIAGGGGWGGIAGKSKPQISERAQIKKWVGSTVGAGALGDERERPSHMAWGAGKFGRTLVHPDLLYKAFQ